MQYNITLYSTALFSTWIHVEELNLLIDAGDGLTAGLLQKARKIKHAFITHPDRDHLNGLPQFIQLNSRPNFPKIYYPKDSGSFPAMNNFLQNFDPHIKGAEWIGIEDRQVIPIKKGFEIEAMRNEHIASPIGTHKSLSYKLYETKQKLKAEFRNLSPSQIQKIAQEKGKAFLSEEIRNHIISFSGDTPVDDYEKWNHSNVLIHEATFMGEDIPLRGNKHSTLEEVLRMVKEININILILSHFSSRYSKEEITHTTRKLIQDLGIHIPVYIAYPGEIIRDILNTKAVNEVEVI